MYVLDYYMIKNICQWRKSDEIIRVTLSSKGNTLYVISQVWSYMVL